MSQAATDELQRRLVSFAVKIIELVGHFPKTPAGRHVSGQILRSGTFPAPNYGEALGAESRANLYINSELPSKSSMRQASGCLSFWKLGWPQPS
jgi:four helix bundle protein